MKKIIIISVTSFKGGVGKTTSSIHLAGQLSAAGKRVAVIDRDRTRSASSWARTSQLPFIVGNEQTIIRNSADFDIVIIDSRGGVEVEELREMAETSDFLILPTNVEYMSLDAMAQTAKSLSEMNSRNYAVLFTMSRGSKRLAEAREILEDDLKLPVLRASVRASEAFKDASKEGVLVSKIKANKLSADCWEDYGQVTREVMALIEQQADQTGPGGAGSLETNLGQAPNGSERQAAALQAGPA